MEESKQSTASQYKYHAFISYRHADNKVQGRQWATWLHQAIETYEVPKDLVGKKNGRGDVIPARIYPIFRDEEELPAHADLGTSIVGALEQTNLLVVLCSPRAVASTYVADEIDYFKKLGGSDRIIAAMIDGEPNTSWDDSKQKLGFTKEDECFPLPLQYEYDKYGNPTDKHAEPIAADFRINNDGKPEQGWTSTEAYRQNLEQTSLERNNVLNKDLIEDKVVNYQKQQKLMLLKIIAGILSISLGELTRRDQAYQLKLEQEESEKLRKWAKNLEIEKNKAKKQLIEANHNLGILLKNKADSLDRDKRFNLANGYRLQAQLQLKSQSHEFQENIIGFLTNQFNVQNAIWSSHAPISNVLISQIAYSSNGKMLATGGCFDDNGALLKVWNVATGELINTFSGHIDDITCIAFSPDSTCVISGSIDQTIKVWNLKTGELKNTFSGHREAINTLTVSDDGNKIASCDNHSVVKLWDFIQGKLIKTVRGHNESTSENRLRPYLDLEWGRQVAFSPDCKMVGSVHIDKKIVLWDLGADKQIRAFGEQSKLYKYVGFSHDGTTIVTACQENTIRLWNVSTGSLIHTMQQQGCKIGSVFFNSTDKRLVSSHENGLTLWDTATGKIVDSLYRKGLNNAILSPTDDNIVASSTGRSVEFLDITKGQVINSNRGHTDTVNGVGFIPSDAVFFSTSKDNSIKFWCSKTGELLNEFVGFDSPIDLFFNDIYGFLITSQEKGKMITVWLDNVPYIRFTDHNTIKTIAVNGKDFSVVSAGPNNTLQVHSLHDKELKREFGKHCSAVSNIFFSPDGEVLVSTYEDGSIILRDFSTNITTGRLVKNIKGHNGSINSIVFSPNSLVLASGGTDNAIKLWDVTSGDLIKSIDIPYEQIDSIITTGKLSKDTLENNSPITKITFSPDGKTMAALLANKVLIFCSVPSGNLIDVFILPKGELFHRDFSVAFRPDEIFIAYTSHNTIKLHEMAKASTVTILEGHTNLVISCAFSQDGSVLVSGSDDGTVKVWDLSSTFRTSKMRYTSRGVFSPDNMTLATQGGNDNVQLWDVETGKFKNNLTLPPKSIGYLNELIMLYSPDGKVFVSGGNKGKIHLLDAFSGALIQTISGHDGEVRCLAFTPDSKILASSGDDRTIKLWNIPTGTLEHTLEGICIDHWISEAGEVEKNYHNRSKPIKSIDFSFDGKFLASNRDNEIKIWDTKTGELDKTLAGHNDKVNQLMFSPESNTLASCSDDRTVKLWDVVSGEILRTLIGHPSYVYSICFNPSGAVLVSDDEDGNTKFWCVSTGQQQFSFPTSKSGLDHEGTSFSPNGKVIISGRWPREYNSIKVDGLAHYANKSIISSLLDDINLITPINSDGLTLRFVNKQSLYNSDNISAKWSKYNDYYWQSLPKLEAPNLIEIGNNAYRQSDYDYAEQCFEEALFSGDSEAKQRLESLQLTLNSIKKDGVEY